MNGFSGSLSISVFKLKINLSGAIFNYKILQRMRKTNCENAYLYSVLIISLHVYITKSRYEVFKER
ncbi:hypothetical protein FAD_1580 [Ferroplasma acidiphilum]|uniref:Uncharacterized protein n=1 Tax=Ferroplasma acidiphilum TaxID=74969 RepID=A0A1V0N5N1_9ARCH|nr:hypothetical protein FAD_1580 [Ferroplasma acidiphilum]